MTHDYEQSQKNLNKLNQRLHTVNERLQEGFRRRIESLNQHNTKTNEIKLKMTKEEQEKKDKDFWDYYLKQEEHHKRVKKQK